MKQIAIFFGALAVFAGLAWIGGYNFDTRNGLVAYYSAGALVISALIAAFPGDF
jgi:hypothetical protein